MRFEDLKFEPLYDGVQAMVSFGKYELSVVKHGFSYGGSKGLYEIAVFEGDSQVELPGITQEGDTVKGFLTEEGVTGIMLKMATIAGTTMGDLKFTTAGDYIGSCPQE